MSFASFVNNLSDAINDGIRAVANSGVIGNAVGKATRVGLNVGKAAGKAGFKVGTGTINTGLKGANFVKDHLDDFKEVGKAFADMGKGVDFMQGPCEWHGKAPKPELADKALAQLKETLGDY